MGFEQSPGNVVDDLINGAQKALVLRAFVLLRIANQVGDDGVPLAELGHAVSAPAPSLLRLLRAATALGLCEETLPERFRLTDAGKLLRAGADGDAAGWAELMTAPWMLAAWGELGPAVQTNNSRFADVHGQDFWEYVGEHPQEAGVFDRAMTSGADGRARDLVDALDWSSIGLAVDVGGGQGRLLGLVLAEQQHARGIVFDRPQVIADPAAEVEAVSDRLEMGGGDFFTAVPEGADVYVLSRIVHDWPDEEAIAVLRACRASMRPNARLCLLEQVAPEAAELPNEQRLHLALKDLNMLVLVGGQERTLRQYRTLLEAADLTLDSVYDGTTCSVIQASGRR